MSTHDILARYHGRALVSAALIMLLAALLQLVAVPAGVLLIGAERATRALDAVLTAAAPVQHAPPTVRAVRTTRITD